MKKELKDTGLTCRGRGFNCHNCERAKTCSEYVECKPIKFEREPDVKYYFSDDEYIHWFECKSCGCNRIVYKSNYCPNCGNNLYWGNVIKNEKLLENTKMKDLIKEIE